MMLKSIREILKEQMDYRDLIIRMAQFETKSMYQRHYLGSLWQYLNPAIQVAIYYTVFGIGLRGGATVEGDVPFLIWLLLGLIPWFFIAPTMIQGSNSVHQKVNLVSKMNFPVSLLPSIRIVGNSYQFFILLLLLLIITLLNGIYPSVYILQLPYYLIALYFFLLFFITFCSTFTTLLLYYSS